MVAVGRRRRSQLRRALIVGAFGLRYSPRVPPTIVFESLAKVLLVLHALAAVVLIGSVGHLGWECLHYLRGRTRNVWLGTVHARVGFVLYAFVFCFGLLAYPTYRVRVRHDVFDPTMPWATNLFDIKEMFGAFGMAAFAALFLMSFAVRPREEADRAMLLPFASIGLLVSAIAIFNSIAGLVLVTFRSI